MVALNAEAPEFYPNNKLQKPHYLHYTFSAPLYRPHPYFYHYPTTSKLPFYSTSFSFHSYLPNLVQPTFPRFESETKPPTHFHDGFENHEQDLENEMAVEPFTEGGDSNRAFIEVISGGGMEHHRSHVIRTSGRFEWRRKQVRKDVEQKEKKFDDGRLMRKNRHRRAKHFRYHCHKKNSRGGFPLVPVQKDGEETTVMIKNIPSKYTYVSFSFHIPPTLILLHYVHLFLVILLYALKLLLKFKTDACMIVNQLVGTVEISCWISWKIIACVKILKIKPMEKIVLLLLMPYTCLLISGTLSNNFNK